MTDLRAETRATGGASRGDEPLRRAMLALDNQRPQEAEQLAAEVLKVDRRDRRALHIFGCALLMQGRGDAAIEPLHAAAQGRHDPELDTLLAIALRQSGRLDEALRRLKLATRRKPPYPAAFHELGYLLVSMGRHDEAIETLQRGLELAPMMPEMSIQLGYAFLRRRDCADAKIAFARALTISPESADALSGLARAHLQLGEDTAAAGCYRRYLIGKPDDASAWLNLGHCLLKLGQRDAGYDCFRTAARGDPKRYGLALASLVAGGRGRFWLKPSAASRFLQGTKS